MIRLCCFAPLLQQEATMKISNLNFNIQVSGEGPAFIWGHGLMGNIASEDKVGLFEWEQFPKDVKLVRYDARGHGKTQPTFSPGDYHWRNLALDMIEVADHLGIDTFIAGGQSMGCATSIYAGLIALERVKGLVLMNPPTAWETRSAQCEFYRRMAMVGGIMGGGVLATILGRDPSRLLPGWLVDAKGDEVFGVLEGLRALKRRTIKHLFTGAARTDLPTRGDIKNINIPALILGWTGDPTHPIETATELHELMPQSTLVTAENYEEFIPWAGLIREFVEGT
jgi:pimeloyl-ACP methyl ester carboxylesterase